MSGSASAASRSPRAVASANGQPVWRRNATTDCRPSNPGSGSSRAGSPGSGGLAVGSGRGGRKVRRFKAPQVTLRSMRLRALAVGAAILAAAGPAFADPILVTHHNAVAPAVGGGRVFWAEQHGRHAALLTATPGGHASTIFRLTGPHAAHSPYAQITRVAASTHFMAFTVSTGYGDPYTCPAIDEHPAGDSRCRAGRETFNALYAGPVGGPYRRLAGGTGGRTSRCRAGSAAGAIDVSGGAVAFAEGVGHCTGQGPSAAAPVAGRDGGGGGQGRVPARGRLPPFPPRRPPHPQILPRFGIRVDALSASHHSLAVGYAPTDGSKTDVLVTSDRQGNHRNELSSELDSVFPWMDCDGSVAAWSQGDPPNRLYASGVGR